MRPKSTNRDLPPRMLRRKKRLKSGKLWVGYYYNGWDEAGHRKEIPLGSNLLEAKRKWASLECADASPEVPGTMNELFDKYEKDELPKLAHETQRTYALQLRHLRAAFGNAFIGQVTGDDVQTYVWKRTGKVQANREASLLRHIFNLAKVWKYNIKENPAVGIKRNEEQPRDYYAEADVWDAVIGAASPEMTEAMNLAYLTGQRPSDVRTMKVTDIRNNELYVKQGKTNQKLRIQLEKRRGTLNELGKLVKRRQKTALEKGTIYLISTQAGKAYTKSSLRRAFNKARSQAVQSALSAGDHEFAERLSRFQFRDIRPKAATDIEDLAEASSLLGHSTTALTKRVYRRRGELVKPTR